MTAPALRCSSPHQVPIHLRLSVATGLCCCCRGSHDTDPTCRTCHRLLAATDLLDDLCNACPPPPPAVRVA